MPGTAETETRGRLLKIPRKGYIKLNKKLNKKPTWKEAAGMLPLHIARLCNELTARDTHSLYTEGPV